MITALRTRDDERLYWAAIGLVIAIAWAITALIGTSHYAPYVGHGGLGERSEPAGHVHHGGGSAVPSSLPFALALLVFAGGWTAMTIAMMLPTSLPLVNLFRTAVRDRAGHATLITLLVLGYLSVWTLFGLLLYVADTALHLVIAAIPALSANSGYLLPAALVVAGAYQFTPLKDHCLRACRSPLSFVVTHWRGIVPGREALRLGAHHGLFCLGCCWTLMLVMFALGAAHVPAMLALGAVMAVEKCMPWGRRLVAPAGVGLLLLGVALAVREILSQLA